MTNLGLFFQKNSVNRAEVYYKTGIDESRLSLLSNDLSTLLYGDDFYLISMAVGAELNKMSDEVFKDFKPIAFSAKNSDKLTDLGKYVSLFFFSKKDLAESAGILQSRFSKLLNDPKKRPYAFEIYRIAKLTNREPKELFELLYGHLDLNTSTEQERLRKLNRK